MAVLPAIPVALVVLAVQQAAVAQPILPATALPQVVRAQPVQPVVPAQRESVVQVMVPQAAMAVLSPWMRARSICPIP